jgi:hypothetical protein
VTRGYVVAAVLLGLVGFAAVEVSGQRLGLVTALTPSAALDAVAFAAATLVLARAFVPAFRRWRGLGAIVAVVLFLLLFAPLAAVIAAALALTFDGAWGAHDLVRGAFINTPINLVVTLVLDLWFVAVPLGLVSATLLRFLARRSGRASVDRLRRRGF